MKAIKILSECRSMIESYVVYPKDFVKEAIDEIKELMEPKTCFNCMHFIPFSDEELELHFEDGKCLDSRCCFRVFQDFGCNEFVAKELA